MKLFKKLLSLALVAIGLLAITIPALAYTEQPASGTRYITSANGNPVNVRTGPGTNYALASVGRFDVGTQVTLQAKATGSDGKTWYKVVNSSNRGGWVRGDFLTTSGGGGGGGQQDWELRYGPGNLSTGGSDSTSQQIRNFQSDLASLRYDLGEGGIDGYYGPDTRDAVILFQKAHGLAADGIAGPATKSLLFDLTLENH